MKLKYCLAIAGFAMAICSCDEGTDNIGMSLTSSNDNINVSTHEFNVLTESFVPDSVYTYNNELYLGRITDPETDITVASSFMMQFNMVENAMMPEKKEITDAHNGSIVADSCVIYLTFDASKTFGDSTTAMKLRLSELDHPVADGVHYTNFDPVKEGYIREGTYQRIAQTNYVSTWTAQPVIQPTAILCGLRRRICPGRRTRSVNTGSRSASVRAQAAAWSSWTTSRCPITGT